jgi:hypothetical protein
MSRQYHTLIILFLINLMTKKITWEERAASMRTTRNEQSLLWNRERKGSL